MGQPQLERSASREQLQRLNAEARTAGREHVADAGLLARLPDGQRALGGAVSEADDTGFVLTTWSLAVGDLTDTPIEHVLIEVPIADYSRLPGWEAAPPPPGGESRGRLWPVSLLLVAAALLIAWLAGDAASVVGAVVAAVALVGGLFVFLAARRDAQRSDYWDALDQFFGQLELWSLGAAAVALAVLGGLVALFGVFV